MMSAADLRGQRCAPQKDAFSADQIAAALPAVPEWQVQDEAIIRQFDFKNYYATLAFINAIAYVIHAEDHHPELLVTYNKCTIKYNTHSVNNGRGGLSINDFICAAKIDALFEQSFS